MGVLPESRAPLRGNFLGLRRQATVYYKVSGMYNSKELRVCRRSQQPQNGSYVFYSFQVRAAFEFVR